MEQMLKVVALGGGCGLDEGSVSREFCKAQQSMSMPYLDGR